MGAESGGFSLHRNLGLAACAVLLWTAPAVMAQPLGGGRLPPLVQKSVDDAYELAYDVDDADCPAIGADLKREIERTQERLRSYREQSRRIYASNPERRKEVIDAINRADDALNDALDDYYEACGGRFFYIPGTETALRISGAHGSVGFQSDYIGKDTGIGNVLVPGDPRFAVQNSTIDGVTGKIGFNFRGAQYLQSFKVAYSQTRSGISAFEPMGGNQVGYVPNNSALGAGANFGNGFDTMATSKVELDRLELNYGFWRPLTLQDYFTTFRDVRDLQNGYDDDDYYDDEFESAKKSGIQLTFRYQDYEHEGNMWRPANPMNVYALSNHDLRTYTALAGPAISGINTSRNGIYLFGSLSAQAGFVSSTLRVSEETCFLCVGMPTFDSFNDSKTDFAWELNARVGLGVSFDKYRAGISLGVRHGTKHVLHVRENPNDGSTRIKTDTGTDLQALLRVSRNF